MSKYHEEYSMRHKVEFRPDEFADDPRTFAHPAIRIICAPAPTTYSLRPPVITSEDVADMLGMTVAQAEEFLLDNSTRIVQRMVASAWSVIADIKRSM